MFCKPSLLFLHINIFAMDDSVGSEEFHLGALNINGCTDFCGAPFNRSKKKFAKKNFHKKTWAL